METIICSFPRRPAKGEAFPLRADSNMYFLDTILPGPPELPDEGASFDEPFDVTHCVNEEAAQKEGTELVTDAGGRHRSC